MGGFPLVWVNYEFRLVAFNDAHAARATRSV